jgi:hypothetical protein
LEAEATRSTPPEEVPQRTIALARRLGARHPAPTSVTQNARVGYPGFLTM